jgi:hypothetical protein
VLSLCWFMLITLRLLHSKSKCVLAIYAPIIYTAPCVMLMMRATSITRASGRGWAQEIETFLDTVKWHRTDRGVPFGKNPGFQGFGSALI